MRHAAPRGAAPGVWGNTRPGRTLAHNRPDFGPLRVVYPCDYEQKGRKYVRLRGLGAVWCRTGAVRGAGGGACVQSERNTVRVEHATNTDGRGENERKVRVGEGRMMYGTHVLWLF